MKCCTLKSDTARRTRPKPPLKRNCALRLERSRRTAGSNAFIGASGARMRLVRVTPRYSGSCSERVIPSGRLAVAVLEELEAADHPDPAEEDLVRPRVVADVIWLAGAVGQVGEACLPALEAVRDPGRCGARDDMAATEGVRLVGHGLHRHRRPGRPPELERPLPVEHDEDLLVGGMAMRRRGLLVRRQGNPVES